MSGIVVTPRVNGQLLRSYVGKEVMLVGKVVAPNVVQTSDNQNVNVVTAFGALPVGATCELDGSVNQDGSLRELKPRSQYSSDFDLTMYDELVKLMNSSEKTLFFP